MRVFTKIRRAAAPLAIAIAILFVTTVFQPALTADAFAGNISGRVFQDFDGDGTFETATTITNDGLGTISVAVDRGIQNVEVRAYSASGVNVTTGGVALTDASGNYTLVTNDAGSGPYRVEFTALPTGFSPSARSTDSADGGLAANAGSTVQFVSAAASNVNLAVNYPTEYSQNNPQVVASMYAAGDQITGGLAGTGVLVSFPYSAGSNDTGAAANEALYDAPTINPLQLSASEIGTTYGLAYARGSRLVYAGAYFKRHAGFGPQGANAIYVINRTGSGAVTNFFTVPGTSANLHDTANYPRDNGNIGWNAVGKSSLGGMAISEDEASLFIYNLADRVLYKLNTSNGAAAASQAVSPNLPLTVGNCPAADVRPFSLTVYRNQLYAGFVCSAESSATVDTFTDNGPANGQYDPGDYHIETNGTAGYQAATESYLETNGAAGHQAGEAFIDSDGNGVYNVGNARNLRAYVFTVNQTTLAYSAAPVFQANLNYTRGLGQRSAGASVAWRPWSATFRSVNSTAFRTVYSQPILSDIAFDNGNLILAIRDRVSDQVGNGSLSNPADASLTNLYQPRPGGDVIRACGTVGAWTLETNGRCAGNGAATQNSGEGPGNSEFYHGDSFTLATTMTAPATAISGKGSNHDETSSGGVEQFPGAPSVMITNFDAIPNVTSALHDGGIRWLSNTTGSFTKGYRLYDGDSGNINTFGKAGGVGGNLVILSDPAPIEVGNRVWHDLNANGVQDPGEPVFAGVTVRLFNSSNVLIATAVTDANGEYYFISGTAPDANITNNIGIVNGQILRSTAYQIRLDNPANYATGQPLFGLNATLANQTLQLGDDDSSDSDALRITNPTGSSAGIFPVISFTTGGAGSNNHTLDIGLRAPSSPTAAFASIEGQVFSPDGRGIRNVRVMLITGNGAVKTVLTSTFGFYRFDGVEAGQTVLVSVSAKRYVFPEPTRSLNVGDNLTNIDFAASDPSRRK